MNSVTGRNVIAELLISGVYYPFFCCKTMQFTQNQETVEITSVNSANSREYTPGMTTASLSVSGVTVLDNTGSKLSITYLMQESIRRAVQTMRIRMISDDGGTLQIAFQALIVNNTLSRTFGQYSQSDTSFTITGTPVISSVIPPPGGQVVQAPLYIACVAGEFSVHDTLLEAAGVVILEVARTGTEFDQVSGTPTAGLREFKFTGGTGNGIISFGDAFNPGETIYILYKV